MSRDTVEALVEKIRAAAQNPKVRLADVLPHAEDPDERVRAAALEALWALPCEATLLTATRAARGDSAPVVQVAAATTLGRYIWAGMQLDEVLDEQFGMSDNITAGEVERARACLLELLGDPSRDRQVRLRALEALSYDADERVHGEIGALWEGNEQDRVVALRCMGRTGHARWRSRIVACLGESSSALLSAAIDAAGEGCVEAAEPRLLELAGGADRALALPAIWALRNVIHTTTGRKVLEKLARGKDLELKQMAKAALADLDAIDVEERPDDGDGD